ncbi:MAG: MarR family winged helix-turn-helix transcriptional regulator [Dehalococcoidia bacterium]|nr:MarR family winged helix-turn-helix transcriptional regulator [Dehalococcoidia bacterium]
MTAAKKTYPCDDRDQELWLLLEQTRNAIYKARSLELEQYGVSPVQAGTMFVIYAMGGKTRPADIARWLVREPHSISGLLSRMETDGLLKREPDPDRRNAVSISLTEYGRDICLKTFQRESVKQILSCLGEDERKQLLSSLIHLRDRALKDRRMRSKPPFPAEH